MDPQPSPSDSPAPRRRRRAGAAYDGATVPPPLAAREEAAGPAADAAPMRAVPQGGPPPAAEADGRGLKAAFRDREHMLPRERLDRLGPAALSDAELLALFLRTGLHGRNVLELAGDVLRAYDGNLRRLSQESARELERIAGIGRVRALELTAIFEFARRVMMFSQEVQPLLAKPEEIVRFLRGFLLQEPTENFYVLPLDKKLRLCSRVQRQNLRVSKGTADASLVHPRDVFREAVRVDASYVVVAHNHPSGDPTPSAQDKRITAELIAAGRVLRIPLLDHVVIGGLPDLRAPDGALDTAAALDAVPRFVSFRRAGLVDFAP